METAATATRYIQQMNTSKLVIEQQHADIIDCCAALRMTLGPDAAIDDIGKVRMRLAKLLHENLVSEEAALNGPIRRLPFAKRPSSFGELGIEAADLRRKYTEHVGRWSLAAMSRDRQGYAASAIELIAEVTSHLDRKRSAFPAWWAAIA